jgi:hypothetical protein
MQNQEAVPCTFKKGDTICMAKGSYQGTVGTFVGLRDDPMWADLLEPNDLVRAHPVEWMALAGAKPTA